MPSVHIVYPIKFTSCIPTTQLYLRVIPTNGILYNIELVLWSCSFLDALQIIYSNRWYRNTFSHLYAGMPLTRKLTQFIDEDKTKGRINGVRLHDRLRFVVHQHCVRFCGASGSFQFGYKVLCMQSGRCNGSSTIFWICTNPLTFFHNILATADTHWDG